MIFDELVRVDRASELVKGRGQSLVTSEPLLFGANQSTVSRDLV